MTTLFWALEYGKVHIAYMILVFVWPSLMFRKYLRGKSLTFRFGFCVTISMLFINTGVLLLGLVGLLRPWFFRLLFYGSMVLTVFFSVINKKRAFKQAGRVLLGTYGIKQLLLTFQTAVYNRGKKAVKVIFDKINGHKAEYVLLGIVLLYGMVYFTYGAFQDYSYGFGDMYPHNAWVYGLVQGQVFSAGVYPEGMHCFIYAMHVLFGIRIYSCMMFTAGVHILVFLLSAYCLFKEIFVSKYTPILALTLFLTIDVVCIDEIYGMSRLQWTIPQEFGLYTLLLCAAFLARYIKAPGQELSFLAHVRNPFLRWMKRWVYNEDLLVFMMALAVSLVIHFYPTIMAFFLCLAFVPLAVHKIFRPSRLIPLITAVLAGCFIAILPMGLALASGIPFQGSIGWAVNVINGTDGENTGAIVLDENTGEEITGDITSLFNKKPEEEQGNQMSSQGQAETQLPQEPVKEPFSIKKVGEGIVHVWQSLVQKGKNVYWYAYVTLYRQERAAILGKMTVLALLLSLLGKIGILICNKLFQKEIRYDLFDGYFALALGSIFFMMLYAANSIGLPSLIAGSRLCSTSQLLLMALCMVPVDAILFGISKISSDTGMVKVAWVGVFGIYAGTILFECFHGYLYFELTRYNSAVMVTHTITERMPKYSYTIVSTVDELYPMIQYGYHEEAVKFINDCVDRDYTLPTEYVFVFVEKHPIEYAQSHFFEGPDWLAVEKYPAYYDSYVSQCPKINKATISPELAESPFYKYPISSRAYSTLASRVVVESRLDKWCKEFERLYPNEMHTYYEDENFICYYFQQNPACLYQLGIQ